MKCQIVAARSDLPGVRAHEGEHLRRFVAARAQGDVAAMRRWWEELVIDFADRMDGLVWPRPPGPARRRRARDGGAAGLTRFADAARSTRSRACRWASWSTRARRWRAGSASTSSAASIRQREREGRSLDAGWDDDAEDRASPTWEADEAVAPARPRASAAPTAARLPRVGAAAAREDRRRVVELTLPGRDDRRDHARSSASRADNAYQLRSRGMKDLAKLKEQYDT